MTTSGKLNNTLFSDILVLLCLIIHTGNNLFFFFYKSSSMRKLNKICNTKVLKKTFSFLLVSTRKCINSILFPNFGHRIDKSWTSQTPLGWKKLVMDVTRWDFLGWQPVYYHRFSLQGKLRSRTCSQNIFK